MSDDNSKDEKTGQASKAFQPTQPEPAKKRKLITMPQRNSPKIIESSIIPAVDLLLHDAKSIVAAELAQYRGKVSRGITLDLKEARVVQGYLETLIKLQKEERDQARSQDLSNLTDEELMDLAMKVLGTSKKE